MNNTKIKNLKKFYKFCVKNGLNVANINFENLDFETPKNLESSFKNRSQEVKSQFNHIFSLPNERQRFFNNDYKEIIFIAKN
jgi:hypothetical protein